MPYLQSVRPFLYPQSDDTHFTLEACVTIVRELSHRNWSVPNIKVTISEHGSGDEWYKCVDKITWVGKQPQGKEFAIFFGREQRNFNFYHDLAGVRIIAIPGKHLNFGSRLSDDEWTLSVYTGKDWRKDKEEWYRDFLGIYWNHGWNNPTERLFKYRKNRKAHYLEDQLTNFDRYDLVPSQWPAENGTTVPESIDELTVESEFSDYLEKVLEYIRRFPEQPQIPEEPKILPDVPPQFAWLYCLIGWRELEQLRQAHERIGKPGYHRYGLNPDNQITDCLVNSSFDGGPGDRLQHAIWSVPDRNRLVPPRVNAVLCKERIEFLIFMGSEHVYNAKENPCIIHLAHADQVFVMDEAAGLKEKAKILEQTGQTELEQHQLRDCLEAQALTLIPISQYTSGYELPVVVIKRQLMPEEIILEPIPQPVLQQPIAE